MAVNRYGQIWHGDHHYINIRFPSTEARLKFQNEFEAYHASHDHEGDIPIFKNVASKDLKLSTGSRSPEDLIKAETDKDYRITIDGYGWNDIHEYHNPRGFSRYFWYHVPTCCVPPIIVIDREFVDSGTLKRHSLSAIFGDMPADDFQSLLESVDRDGFIDPIVRIHEGQILDGWHRYRAAQELNLIRRLKFQEWREDRDEDGDPKAFVLARNIERRHLSASQRAQIAVAFNGRFGHGGDRSKETNVHLKTQAQLADEVKVSAKTIQRATQIEAAGEAEAVIAGEKTAGEVLKEQNAKASAETEAAIAVVKPRFQDVVEKWRSSQVERLRKFEGLPVGRTPLIESEYLKTYFELAQPRIQQNTKPTAAHYEAAIECMRDLPVAFAEQLEGRHYRRIIKEWDESVLPQLIKRLQGPLLGYSTGSKLKADAFGVRIRRAIRRQYEFQGRIPAQSFEVLFEITEDAHAVLVQLNPKEWFRGGREISWALSVLPEPTEKEREASKLQKQKKQSVKSLWDTHIQVARDYTDDSDTDLNLQLTLPELVSRVEPDDTTDETVESLWEKITPAISAWKSERKGQGVGHASKTMFVAATKRFDSELTKDAETDVVLLQKLLDFLTELHGPIHTFERYVKMQCDGASIWNEDDTLEQLQDEHVKRIEALPGEIKAALPAWKAQHAMQGNITLRFLVNARCELEFGRERGPDPFFREEMEEVLERIQSNDAYFAKKVCELLDSNKEVLPLQEAVDEMKTEVDPERVSIPDSHRNLVAIAGSLIEDFDAHFEKLGIVGEEAYMELFEKAASHYSFDLTHFLYITEMYNAAEYKEAQVFWESLTQPHRHAWMNTLMSMQSDLKNRENWAKGIGDISQPDREGESEVSDTGAFDWNSVRPDFDPEKHEWLQVVIQRGKNHTTVTKIPTGPAHFHYGEPETEVVIPQGLFSIEELTDFAAELSEIFAKWVAGDRPPTKGGGNLCKS